MLGHAEAAAIVAKAAGLFESSEYARLPRSRRGDAELDEATTRALDALGGRLCRDADALNRAIERYIEEHPAAFAAAAPRRINSRRPGRRARR